MSLAARVFFLALILLPHEGSAQLADGVAACRFKFAAATRKYSVGTIERMLMCERNRLGGEVAPDIDCYDESTWSASGFSRGVDLHQKSLGHARRMVSVCSASFSPVDLGYVACPTPCESISLDSMNDLVECMSCVVADTVIARTAMVLGNPPLPASKSVEVCEGRIGRNLTKYLNARLFAQHLCQSRKERGDSGFVDVPDCAAVDDAGHPFYGYVDIIHRKLTHWVTQRCHDVDFTSMLDTCGRDAASVASCVEAASRACDATLFDLAFP